MRSSGVWADLSGHVKNSIGFHEYLNNRCSLPRPVHEDGSVSGLVFSEINSNMKNFFPPNPRHGTYNVSCCFS